MRDGGGGGDVWYIRKALEKGFSDMYGSWGGSRWYSAGNVVRSGILGPFFRNLRASGHDFDPVWVTFSGFWPRTPLKPWN